jgi:hypothetical protein
MPAPDLTAQLVKALDDGSFNDFGKVDCLGALNPVRSPALCAALRGTRISDYTYEGELEKGCLEEIASKAGLTVEFVGVMESEKLEDELEARAGRGITRDNVSVLLVGEMAERRSHELVLLLEETPDGGKMIVTDLAHAREIFNKRWEERRDKGKQPPQIPEYFPPKTAIV